MKIKTVVTQQMSRMESFAIQHKLDYQVDGHCCRRGLPGSAFGSNGEVCDRFFGSGPIGCRTQPRWDVDAMFMCLGTGFILEGDPGADARDPSEDLDIACYRSDRGELRPSAERRL